jgi:Bacterial surface proteins containing Ig-like domains
MPVIPNIVQLSATSTQILNTIRNQNGGYYQSVVPIADGTTDTIRQIGTVIMGNQDLQNAFLSALINRIGRVILTSRLYENPWAGFKKGMLEYGETVEEIFVNIASPHQFNPNKAEQEVFKRVIPDVRAEFHPMNYQKFYKVSISNDQLRQAFLSMEGITDLIGRIIDSLYTGANFDELITMKYLIAKFALAGNIYPLNIPAVNATNAREIVSTIKGISNELEFLKDQYNISGVMTTSKKDDQYLIMNAKFDAVIDVEVLATSFNMNKAEFMGHRVPIDSFSFSTGELNRLNELFEEDASYIPFTDEELTILKTIPCALVDRDWFMVFDNYQNMTEQYNGEGLYWNYWYHVWKTFSVSPFSNGILFTTETPAITGVTVSPSTASVAKGNSLQLTASVMSSGFADKDVTWTISGTNVVASSINQSGLLMVGKTESATSIIATATSKYDGSKKGTATITITT